MMVLIQAKPSSETPVLNFSSRPIEVSVFILLFVQGDNIAYVRGRNGNFDVDR